MDHDEHKGWEYSTTGVRTQATKFTFAASPTTAGNLFSLTNMTYIILKQHSYKKTLNKRVNYIKVPEGHKPKNATSEQITGGRLQWHLRRMEPELRRGLAKSRDNAGESQMILEKSQTG
jgi:hypothetical protein